MLAHRLVSSHLPASHLTMCSPLCLMPKFHVLIPHTPLSCVSTPQVYTIQCHFTPSPFIPHLQYPTPHTLTLRINTPPPIPSPFISTPHPPYPHPSYNPPLPHTHPHPSIHHTLTLLSTLTYPPHVSHLLPPYGITPHTSPSHLNTSHHNTHLYTTTSPSHLRTSLHAASQPQPHTLIC